ncbi:MAG: Amuc_1098 family type IV pilus outer membrane protein [Verrucomicrobiota bacterium]
METVKPIIPSRGRAALLATACLIVPLMAGESRTGSSLAETELSRRSVAIDEAQELLKKGDEAYTAGRYADAVVAYSGARDLIPDAPVSAELRIAATERYAQASVEHARALSRKGDVAGARTAVDKVLAESVAPNNPGALAMRAQLDDPIRTNPALTAEHAKDVDSVRRLLYTAEGAFNLGKFDEAHTKYEEVLRIDPTNTAARRGMEQLANTKRQDYQKAAYDQTRAEMLSQVDSQWELQIPAPALDPSLTDSADMGSLESSVSVRNKLDRIIIPKIALDQASLEEALDFLRLRTAENDTTELDPSRKGVNFAVNLGPADSPAATKVRAVRFDLQLVNVPVSQILKYITDITQTSYTTDDFSVIITATGSASAELVARTYRVPPDFISSLSNGGTTEAAAADPFAETSGGEGLLPKRLGAQEALAKQGVTFPPGSSVSYIASASSLRVVNTATNQDYISQIIETLTKTEPVMVAVRVTMIKVQQSHLEELGFDWILDNFGFGGAGWVPGSSKLNLSGGTVGNGDNLDDIILPNDTVTRNEITSGNRSGDSAISGNSLDSLLNDPSGRQNSNRAPGVIGIRGDLSNATYQMLMRGLDQKKGVDMMAQPSTVTRSGQSSSIAVVREFLYPTEYEPPELPNNAGGDNGGENGDIFGGFIGGGGGIQPVTPATPTAFQKRDIGITLEVLPVVDPGKHFVNVTLNPVFSDFDGFVNYGSPINTTTTGLLGPETVALTENAILMPVFSKQSPTTSVDVADGATIVVGGLMSEQVQNVEDSTPVLGSIPIVGRLFQSKARQPVSTAILFLVNVEIMDPTGRSYRDR